LQNTRDDEDKDKDDGGDGGDETGRRAGGTKEVVGD